jgi:rRNA maturation endonuclease Nob1
MNEIKDERARLFLDNLPYQMQVLSTTNVDEKD